jgi:DeoR/GlpR family transcriptional regulator of sugar metabolism
MTESEILALLDRVRGPVIATADVAEHFDSTTEGARRKLNDLCDSGRLDRRKVGGTRVYWRTDAGDAGA